MKKSNVYEHVLKISVYVDANVQTILSKTKLTSGKVVGFNTNYNTGLVSSFPLSE